MLTRLEIDGFKTFEDMVVELHPFTAVLGANAAGRAICSMRSGCCRCWPRAMWPKPPRRCGASRWNCSA